MLFLQRTTFFHALMTNVLIGTYVYPQELVFSPDVFLVHWGVHAFCKGDSAWQSKAG